MFGTVNSVQTGSLSTGDLVRVCAVVTDKIVQKVVLTLKPTLSLLCLILMRGLDLQVYSASSDTEPVLGALCGVREGVRTGILRTEF